MKNSEPNHKVGDVVMLYPSGKVQYIIRSRSPHPIRPDWPWRYDLEPINSNGPIRRCVDDNKLYALCDRKPRNYYIVEDEEEEL